MDKCYCTESNLGSSGSSLPIRKNHNFLEERKPNFPKLNKHGVAMYHVNYRNMLLKQTINPITELEWLDMLSECNYTCAYCGVAFNFDNMPVKDHIIPVSKGGNNTKENIAPACRSCNAKKGNRYHRSNGELWAKDNKLINARFCL